MRNLFFWQRWPTPERTIFNIAALWFLLAAAALGYYYAVAPSPVVEFRTIVESQLAELPFEEFKTGIFDLAVPANYYTVTQRLLGTPLTPNLTASYLWLACFAVAITGLLAVATTTSRYYYLAAMGVFILLVVSLKLETLLVFGRDDKMFTVAVLIIYGACSFYMFYFRPEMKFAARFLCFAASTAAVACIIFMFSTANYPAIHLATYSFQAGMIACILFTVTVSHEIVASFIVMLTREGRRGKTLNHFLIITLIYLVNLALAYSVKFGYVTWNIMTVNLYLLLAVSGVLGLWGLRQRQKQLEGIIDIEPDALTGYAFLGAMALGAIAWFLGTGNDPAYDAVADIIIFTHLGYGFIFLLYVISNFGGPLSKNMAVHKVLYSPTAMPFFTFRLAGLITSLALVIYNSWQVPAHNATAGFQNAVADLYLIQDNARVAAVYYDQGRTYGYSNHHSNYALANLAGLKFDQVGEKAFYKAASYKRPTEMSYLNWAQMYQAEGQELGALTVLEEGMIKLPGSSAISNTAGLLYAARKNPDSAMLAFGNADDAMTQANMLALAARKQFPLVVDTSYNAGDDPALMTNKIAFAAASGTRSGVRLVIPTDSSITVAQAAYLNNYLAQHPGAVDTASLTRIEQLARFEVNAGLLEPLLFSCALSRYSRGEIRRAFVLMEEVAITSSNKGKYNDILARWCLEQGDPVRAKGYAEFAISQKYSDAPFTHAVALTEELSHGSGALSQYSMVLNTWDSLALSGDSAIARTAQRARNILQASLSSIEALDPRDRYGFVRYRVQISDTSVAMRVISSLKDEDLRARCLLDLSRRLLQNDDVAASAGVLRKGLVIPMTDSHLDDELRLQHRLLLSVSENLAELRSADESPLNLTGRNAIYRNYFDGLMASASGDTLRASKAFEYVVSSSWFFDEGLIAAAQYFQSHSTEALKSYNLLAEAIQHHPSSVRLRKAYIREAKRMGFDDFVQHAMDELRLMIPEADYRRFAVEIGS